MTLKFSCDLGGASTSFEPKCCLQLMDYLDNSRFYAAWMADHILQWFATGAHAPMAFPWIGAALERTSRIPIGVDVTTPIGGRYHPVVVAQVFATLGNMYPGRVVMGLGVGEAMNEYMFFHGWPKWDERGERLAEAIELTRKYWTSQDYFRWEGKYFPLELIYCLDKPKKPIPIYVSGFGPKSAYLAGRYGDHLMTWAAAMDSREKIKNEIFPAFERGARDAGKDPSKMEKMVCWTTGYGNIEKTKKKFRVQIAGGVSPVGQSMAEPDPRKIEAAGVDVKDEVWMELAHVYSSPGQYIELVQSYIEIGADHFLFFDYSYDPRLSIKMFNEKLIPHFLGKRREKTTRRRRRS